MRQDRRHTCHKCGLPLSGPNLKMIGMRGRQVPRCVACADKYTNKRRVKRIEPRFFVLTGGPERVGDHSRCIPGEHLCAECLSVWCDAAVATMGVATA